MRAAAVRDIEPAAGAANSVREVMLKIVRQKFEQDHATPVDTAKLFEEVTREVGQGSSGVKRIELSRALFDLMDERVVKWDRGFRLVSASASALASDAKK